VHKKAREYAPNARLILNEFDVLKNDNTRNQFLEIATILKDSGLVDALGCQGHWLEGTSALKVQTSLDILDTLGLPVYITELDLSFSDDNQQLYKYKELFPVMWEHPAVKGITLWGYREGRIWRENAFLLRKDGSERPAMQWLRTEYFAETGVPYARITSPVTGQFFKVSDAGITIDVETEDGGSPVTRIDFFEQGVFLGSDEAPPFSFLVPASDPEKSYYITAEAFSADHSFYTNGTSFALMERSTAMPWSEEFGLDNGTVQRRDSLAWNTMGEITGTFSVQDGRFTGNNMDGIGAWTCLTDISGTSGVNIEVDLQAAGGLNEGQDYVKISYRIDDGDTVGMFYGDGLFNEGNLLTVNADSVSGKELQIYIEVYNTGNSEYYYIDRVSIIPLVDHTGISLQEESPFIIWPNPAGERFYISLDRDPLGGEELNIFDLSGKKVMQHEIHQRETTIVHGLSEGIYLVRITAPASIPFIRKLIIE
jgi:hypothetical protein